MMYIRLTSDFLNGGLEIVRGVKNRGFLGLRNWGEHNSLLGVLGIWGEIISRCSNGYINWWWRVDVRDVWGWWECCWAATVGAG